MPWSTVLVNDERPSAPPPYLLAGPLATRLHELRVAFAINSKGLPGWRSVWGFRPLSRKRPAGKAGGGRLREEAHCGRAQT